MKPGEAPLHLHNTPCDSELQSRSRPDAQLTRFEGVSINFRAHRVGLQVYIAVPLRRRCVSPILMDLPTVAKVVADTRSVVNVMAMPTTTPHCPKPGTRGTGFVFSFYPERLLSNHTLNRVLHLSNQRLYRTSCCSKISETPFGVTTATLSGKS